MNFYLDLTRHPRRTREGREHLQDDEPGEIYTSPSYVIAEKTADVSNDNMRKIKGIAAAFRFDSRR